ncbi:MAG: type 1 glutamine amidotransferase [Acidobacteria bacterium]|nr:type 1 glutamine amidotransferase [Acidobacteriota bacterium]
MVNRPRIAIVGRFTEHASAIRSLGVVSSRRLLEAVWVAGGEPITFLPVENPNWEERLQGIKGVLIPGGGDVNPKWYGEEPNTEELYGVDDLQDENDFSIAKYAFDNGLPALAICRGFQLVNVLMGGSLVQHMDKDHRNFIHQITIDNDMEGLGLSKPTLESSCFHHQSIKKLGDGLEVLATASEGHVEAFKIPSKAWAYGVQWHPEDNYKENPQQLELFQRLVIEASKN